MEMYAKVIKSNELLVQKKNNRNCKQVRWAGLLDWFIVLTCLTWLFGFAFKIAVKPVQYG